MGVFSVHEKTYRLANSAPWSFSEPHSELVKLIENNQLEPCAVLEVGCGDGFHAIYLASMGFKVTAFDSSLAAIENARANASKAGVACNFQIMDHDKIGSFHKKFDFIFDWRFLHELTNEEAREKYISLVADQLTDNGKYLTVSFSGESTLWGDGKIRKAPNGNELYFATMADMKALLEKRFNIISEKTVLLPQKPELKISGSYFLSRKK